MSSPFAQRLPSEGLIYDRKLFSTFLCLYHLQIWTTLCCESSWPGPHCRWLTCRSHIGRFKDSSAHVMYRSVTALLIWQVMALWESKIFLWVSDRPWIIFDFSCSCGIMSSLVIAGAVNSPDSVISIYFWYPRRVKNRQRNKLASIYWFSLVTCILGLDNKQG